MRKSFQNPPCLQGQKIIARPKGCRGAPYLTRRDTRLEAALTGSQDGCRYVVAARFQRAQCWRHLAASRCGLPLHPVQSVASSCILVQEVQSKKSSASPGFPRDAENNRRDACATRDFAFPNHLSAFILTHGV